MNKEEIVNNIQIFIDDFGKEKPIPQFILSQSEMERAVRNEYMLNNLQERIDKAIEYIENYRDIKTKRLDTRLKKILEILKGDSNE